jgi:predicted membrane protein
MENNDLNKREERFGLTNQSNRSGRVLAGLVIVLVGVALLSRQLDFIVLPRWVFTWKMLLIVIGLFISFKHSFRNVGGIILILIGGVFLIEDIVPGLTFRTYIIPVGIIIVGLWMILFPSRRSQYKERWRRTFDKDSESKEDVLDTVTVFGGIKKNIISKDFKGGEVTTVFGGTELNLTQADFELETTIEIVQVFGGTKLIVPANWEIKSELTAILAGIDDKRLPVANVTGPRKVLILKGTSFLGGIEIRSY